MHRANYVCSTPEFGQDRTISDIALSEIRRVRSRGETTDSSVNHKPRRIKANKRCKQRVKRVKKKIITAPRNLATDSNSDSEFETVNEYETSGGDIKSSGNNLPKNRLFSVTDNSTAADSPVKLFVSPNPEKWENYKKLLDVSEEEEEEEVEMFSSLELQEDFRDSATYKSYVVPAPVIEKKQMKKQEEIKKKLTASKVSFSLKWPNPVASKYNSPSEIPSREDTRISKYSHLNVHKSDKFKRFVSPRKRTSRSSSVDYGSQYEDEDVYHVPMRKDSGNEFKFYVKPLRERYSKNDHSSSIDRSIGKNLSLIFEECVEMNSTIENRTPKKSEFDLLKSKSYDRE